MPPKKSGSPTKRERERIIQGWYDPAIPEDLAVLEAFNRLKESTGRPAREVLGVCITYTARAEGVFDQLVTYSKNAAEQDMRDIASSLRDLLSNLQAGAYFQQAPAEVTQAFEAAQDTIDAISTSIGKTYQPFIPQ